MSDRHRPGSAISIRRSLSTRFEHGRSIQESTQSSRFTLSTATHYCRRPKEELVAEYRQDTLLSLSKRQWYQSRYKPCVWSASHSNDRLRQSTGQDHSDSAYMGYRAPKGQKSTKRHSYRRHSNQHTNPALHTVTPRLHRREMRHPMAGKVPIQPRLDPRISTTLPPPKSPHFPTVPHNLHPQLIPTPLEERRRMDNDTDANILFLRHQSPNAPHPHPENKPEQFPPLANRQYNTHPPLTTTTNVQSLAQLNDFVLLIRLFEPPPR